MLATLGTKARAFAPAEARLMRAVGVRSVTMRSLTEKGAFELVRSANVGRRVEPVVIVVNPFSAANIGSVSRNMLCFGLTELRLVQPACDHLGEEARTLAVGSVDLLEHAAVFPSLGEALKDTCRAFATTARMRDVSTMVYTPQAAAREVARLARETEPSPTLEPLRVALVFGRERGGLTSGELDLCDSVINIPTNDNYSVLNLAQSVNILAYEMSKELAADQEASADASEGEEGKWFRVRTVDRLATRADLEQFLDRLEQQLNLRGYRSVSRNNNSDQQGEEQEQRSNFKGVNGIFSKIPYLTLSEVQVLQGMLSNLCRPPRG